MLKITKQNLFNPSYVTGDSIAKILPKEIFRLTPGIEQYHRIIKFDDEHYLVKLKRTTEIPTLTLVRMDTFNS